MALGSWVGWAGSGLTRVYPVPDFWGSGATGFPHRPWLPPSGPLADLPTDCWLRGGGGRAWHCLSLVAPPLSCAALFPFPRPTSASPQGSCRGQGRASIRTCPPKTSLLGPAVQCHQRAWPRDPDPAPPGDRGWGAGTRPEISPLCFSLRRAGQFYSGDSQPAVPPSAGVQATCQVLGLRVRKAVLNVILEQGSTQGTERSRAGHQSGRAGSPDLGR